MSDLTIDDLARFQRAGRTILVVDVRTAEEFAAGHIAGARNIPGADLAAHLHDLQDADLVVTACGKGGGRSADAATLLRELGVNAQFLAGGTFAWLAADPGSDRSEP